MWWLKENIGFSLEKIPEKQNITPYKKTHLKEIQAPTLNKASENHNCLAVVIMINGNPENKETAHNLLKEFLA